MIIGITGSRNIEEHNEGLLLNEGKIYDQKIYKKVYREIDVMVKFILKEKKISFNDITFVSGMARGVDEIFAIYAMERNIPLILSIPKRISSHKTKPIYNGIKSQAIEYTKILEYVKKNNTSSFHEIQKHYNGKDYYYETFARNQHIVDVSDIVISYKKRSSNGTNDRIKKSQKKKNYFGNVTDILEKAKEKYNLVPKEYLKYEFNKDIFTLNTHVIMQGCNCFNTMGRGIAKIITKKYPTVLSIDKKFLLSNGIKNLHNNFSENEDNIRRNKILGNFSIRDINKNNEKGKVKYIVNLYSQYTYWENNDKFKIKAYKNSLDSRIQYLINQRKNNGTIKIALPRIGMGLAKGNVNQILEETEKIFDKYKNDNIYFQYVFNDNYLINKVLDFSLNNIKINEKTLSLN